MRYPKPLVWETTSSSFLHHRPEPLACHELSQGWEGYLITHEISFTVLDSALMAMAVGVFNAFFPARHLSAKSDEGERNKETKLWTPRAPKCPGAPVLGPFHYITDKLPLVCCRVLEFWKIRLVCQAFAGL